MTMPSCATARLRQPTVRPVDGAIATLMALATWAAMPATAGAATTVLIGETGKTFASSAPQCAVHPVTGQPTPMVQAGLFNPRRQAEAHVSLDSVAVAQVDRETPSVDVWLTAGDHSVAVALSRRKTDRYSFSVPAGLCDLPSTAGNFFSPDGTLEYAASGKSYLTVTPGCAINPASGAGQPFVNLFVNGSFLLNVSVNGVPLTQLSALRPRTAVFLRAGSNVITAANASISTDTFVREGGTGQCTP